MGAMLAFGGFGGPGGAAAQGSEPIGDFYFSEARDPFAGDDLDLLFTITLEQTSAQGVLGWKCDAASSLRVQLIFGKYVSGGGVDAVDISARFDNEPAMEVAGCHMLGNHEGAMLHLEETPGFTAAAKRGNQLLLDVRAPSGETWTYTFSLTGLTRGLKRLPCAAALP